MVGGHVLMTTTVLSAYIINCSFAQCLEQRERPARHHLSYSPGQKARLLLRGTSYARISAKDLRRFQ